MARCCGLAQKPPDEDAELVRVTLNLPRSVLEKVERLAQKRGLNKTTVIRRAIDIEDWIEAITENDGKVLVKERGTAELKEVVFR